MRSIMFFIDDCFLANLLEYKKLKSRCSSGDGSKRNITSHMNPKIWADYSKCNRRHGNGKGCTLSDNKISGVCSDLQSNECGEITPTGPEYLSKVCERKIGDIYKTSMLTGKNIHTFILLNVIKMIFLL